MVYLPPQFLVPETASSSLSLPEAGTLALITHLTASGKDSRRPHFLRPHEPLELLTINRQNCTITFSWLKGATTAFTFKTPLSC